jgi:site-specific recombinase XerD
MSSGLQRYDQRAEHRTDADWRAQFRAYLKKRGHSPGTARGYDSAVGHFLSWWQAQAVEHRKPLGPALVGRFLEDHLPVCSCPAPVVRSAPMLHAGLNQFLLMNDQPRLSRPEAPIAAALADSVRDFDHYLQHVCALAEQTRRTRCRLVAEFLTRVFGNGPLALERLTPGLLLETINTWAAQTPPSATTARIGALRSYLRFLCFRGVLGEDLSCVLPTPAHWRLGRVPAALSAPELARFWAVFDRSTAVGLRDDAMAHCLADLGLRCHEVAELSLEAIDWRRGVLTLSHTKSRRRDQLPLPDATGEALVAYLRQGRPACSTRALFVHHRAPLGAPVAKTTVRGAIRRAFQRADLPWSGTHVLRHTAARRMLQGGCSLKEIADVLRHRSLETTAIYAKVDLPHLAQVALPWPEVRP